MKGELGAFGSLSKRKTYFRNFTIHIALETIITKINRDKFPEV